MLDFASAAKVSRGRMSQIGSHLRDGQDRYSPLNGVEKHALTLSRTRPPCISYAGSRGVVWDNGTTVTYLGNTCISCLLALNFLTSPLQASCKSSCQACIQRMPHTHAKKVRINGVGIRAGTSVLMRMFPFPRSGKRYPSMKYKKASEVEGSESWTTRSHLMVH